MREHRLHGKTVYDMKIELFIERIAKNVLTAVSEMYPDGEVVIVGPNGKLIGTTDKYIQVKKNQFYMPYIEELLHSNTPMIIDNPRENPICQGCPNISVCYQTLEVCIPIHIGNNWNGYLSMVVFTEASKKFYLERKEQVFTFLQTILDLMINAGNSETASLKYQHISNMMNIMFQHLDSVAFSCNRDGDVRICNAAFYEFFGLEPAEEHPNMHNFLSEDNALLNVLKNREAISNQELPVIIHNKMNRMIVTSRVIDDLQDDMTEFLFFLRTLDDVRQYIAQDTPQENALDSILGKSAVTMELKSKIRQFAASTSTVLIRGETGTGKELIARSLHGLSPRNQQPFITINCAAIPDSLLESELFGYEKGTFTGASKGGKAGLFEIANGGTIFLDEIGDMPLHLQAKLLRVLQDRKVIRLGGYHPTNLDIRIIAATNQDLEKLVDENKFRSDLYYRLNILPISVLPLRERMADFDDLVFHFIVKYNEKLSKRIYGIDKDFLQLLKNYPWPGNVRQLENTIEYAVNITEGSYLKTESCPAGIIAEDTAHHQLTLKEQLKQEESRIIQEYLDRYGSKNSSITEIAKILGISRASLYGKIKEYKLSESLTIKKEQ